MTWETHRLFPHRRQIILRNNNVSENRDDRPHTQGLIKLTSAFLPCRSHRLPAKQRSELFLKICELDHICPPKTGARYGSPDGASRFQCPGQARPLASYSADGLVHFIGNPCFIDIPRKGPSSSRSGDLRSTEIAGCMGIPRARIRRALPLFPDQSDCEIMFRSP